MVMDRIDLTSFMSSIVLHISLIILLASGIFKVEPKKVVLITDVTLIDINETLGQKGQEKDTVGIEEKQKEFADTLKKEVKPKKVIAKNEVVDTKKLLKKIEEEKQKLNLGINKDDLKNMTEQDKGEEISEELNEGGEVVAGSQPTITGEIATRKYKRIDWKFPKKLPEETELAIEIVVLPSGIIKSVKLLRTSGYPELDNMAISQARNLQFEPIPSSFEQRENVGILFFKFGAEK
jgi:TonB family protein